MAGYNLPQARQQGTSVFRVKYNLLRWCLQMRGCRSVEDLRATTLSSILGHEVSRWDIQAGLCTLPIRMAIEWQ
jgi:hypothetical protein